MVSRRHDSRGGRSDFSDFSDYLDYSSDTDSSFSDDSYEVLGPRPQIEQKVSAPIVTNLNTSNESSQEMNNLKAEVKLSQDTIKRLAQEIESLKNTNNQLTAQIIKSNEEESKTENVFNSLPELLIDSLDECVELGLKIANKEKEQAATILIKHWLSHKAQKVLQDIAQQSKHLSPTDTKEPNHADVKQMLQSFKNLEGKLQGEIKENLHELLFKIDLAKDNNAARENLNKIIPQLNSTYQNAEQINKDSNALFNIFKQASQNWQTRIQHEIKPQISKWNMFRKLQDNCSEELASLREKQIQTTSVNLTKELEDLREDTSAVMGGNKEITRFRM